ncbi:MAG: hypothetical protein ACRD96_08360 [Bryobacteraceae bacterium]
MTLTRVAPFLAAVAAFAQPAAWVARSNENAKLLLDVTARFFPEGAAQLGLEGLDERIMDLSPGAPERLREATRSALRTLRERLDVEKDPLVRQDLEILLTAAGQTVRSSEAAEKYLLMPSSGLAQSVFSGLRALLDDQVAAARRLPPAAGGISGEGALRVFFRPA